MKKIIIIILMCFVQPSMAQEAEKYTCPMHPHYIADEMGTCPICGMDLVPLSGGDSESKTTSGGVVVSPEMIQTMGIRTAPARIRSLGESIRSYGIIKPSTRLEFMVASRVEGWIEELYVSAEGDHVSQGELLYRIYSPDLIAAQRDYLNALNSGVIIRINSAEKRLQSLGMQSQTIPSLKKSRKIIERIPVYAEKAGTVAALYVRDGDYVKPGADMMLVQNYNKVWVMAAVAEKDLPRLDAGAPVRLSFPDSNQTKQGRIDYIYPTVDDKTRTGTVRVIVSNPNNKLKPGAYVDLTFTLDQSKRLTIPVEAILRDNRGSHVIVYTTNGGFRPRKVITGITGNEYIEIVAGLTENEKVVVSGQFLLDSEASLREGFQKMSPPTAMEQMDQQTPLSSLPVDEETLALLDHFIDASLYFHEALIDGYRIDPYFLDAAIKAGDVLLLTFSQSQLEPIIRNAQASIRKAQNSVEQENHQQALQQSLAELLQALQPWLLEGAPIHYRDLGLFLFRDEASGELWLQEGSPPVNPYGKNGESVIVWPDPMAQELDPLNPQPATGHNH
ncbi:MAG: efflux RND transporter periplasmic adaptor subunit [bacterium]